MWKAYGKSYTSRLLLGTARYPSPEILKQAIARSQTELVTVSLRRQSPGQRGGERFWEMLRSSAITVLPNTAGCRTVKEAVTTAHLARELFNTPLLKLEVIGDEVSLAPDPFGLVEAAKILIADGFHIFPYTTADCLVADRLCEAGCEVLMPWGSPIGSGQGLVDTGALRRLRARFPQVPMIIDAGIGRPSHAVQAMELGADAVLINTAVALATDPPAMADAFRQAIVAGRQGYESGPMSAREEAVPSTPTAGLAVLS